MATIIPYINFITESEQAIEFYRDLFGGNADVQHDGDRVVQLEFTAGEMRFMGADLPDERFGRESSMVLNCDSEEQLREFHTKLTEGGKEVFSPMDSGWGAIVSHCTDRFGVTWMLNYDQPQN